MINKCKQNVRYKPFEWADITLIIQFDFCPKCKYFANCYALDEVAQEYDGKPMVVRGQSNYISRDCGKYLISEDTE
jgi:hypothetical protein